MKFEVIKEEDNKPKIYESKINKPRGNPKKPKSIHGLQSAQNKLRKSSTLKDAVNSTDSAIQYLENEIMKLKAEIILLKSNLSAHINRQYGEIRIWESKLNKETGKRELQIDNKGNKIWGDYTGNFYCDSKDEEEVIIRKAREHYEEYFRNGFWHKDKTLGIFITNKRSGKRLIKEYNTGE